MRPQGDKFLLCGFLVCAQPSFFLGGLYNKISAVPCILHRAGSPEVSFLFFVFKCLFFCIPLSLCETKMQKKVPQLPIHLGVHLLSPAYVAPFLPGGTTWVMLQLPSLVALNLLLVKILFVWNKNVKGCTLSLMWYPSPLGGTMWVTPQGLISMFFFLSPLSLH